ncbi:OmpH porin-like protein H precursor [Marinobacter nitratireducens]|uniref:OmpH porin-like protein H n=1 Tax=Marinobacter nitratireducens TaxID=1137280 RepID=A0A072N654_9GAMM|nr:porin [Marinobacter nitratireducens]KEF33174.1 OmpH porin-like protein H precursor [Marinobacter nitratireducens]
MKKRVLALAVSTVVFAHSSAAATIYDGDGLTYQLKGDWQIQLRDSASESESLDLEFDDMEVKNTVTYDLGENLQAFGQLDFSFDKAAESQQSGDKLEEAYMGIRYNNVAVRAGKMNTAGDEFGVESAYEKPAGMNEDQFEAMVDAGDDVLRVDADFDIVYLSLSHELESEGNPSAGDASTDLFVSTSVEALTLAAAYQVYDNNADSWGVSAEYDAGIVNVGADYSVSDLDNSDRNESTYNVVGVFKASQSTAIALGYVNVDDEIEALDAWYANVTYRFPAQKNIALFAEVSDSDAGDESDILAGMQIKF